jgi:hypothetical protein
MRESDFRLSYKTKMDRLHGVTLAEKARALASDAGDRVFGGVEVVRAACWSRKELAIGPAEEYAHWPIIAKVLALLPTHCKQ